MIAPVGEASWGEEELLGAGLRRGRRSWPALRGRARGRRRPAEVPYRRCGALHVALDPDEAAELRRRARARAPARARGAGAARQRVPALEPGLASVNAGIEAPGEAEIDPRALLEALRAACAASGVRFVDGTVADGRSTQRADRGWRLRAAAAERVFLAAGAWAGAEGLLGRDRPRLPVRPVKGEIVRLRAEAGAMPCERIIAGERFYIVPRAEGEIVIGATVEERGFDLAVTAGGVHELLREAYRALPELAELELIETAAGLRPGSPDNAPAIGPLPGDDERRVIVVAGLYRNGILLAPMIAAAADAALLVGELPAELGGADAGPARPPPSREVAGVIDRAQRRAARDRRRRQRRRRGAAASAPSRRPRRRRRRRRRGRRPRSSWQTHSQRVRRRRPRSRSSSRPREARHAASAFELGGRSWGSRLIVGTGGFRSMEDLERALVASGTEIVTVALRRVDPLASDSVIDVIDRLGLFVLPNTAGCYTARDAIRTAELAREAFETDWIKLEVIGDDRTLLPDAGRARRRGRAARRRRLHGAAVHHRRPGPGAPPGGGRLRRGDAARLADRLRRRHPQPLQRADHRRAGARCR